MTDYQLLHNIHRACLPPGVGDTYLVEGQYEYYHYCCDKLNDRGWGCGYRTLQTICSWIKNTTGKQVNVPTIRGIQSILVEMEDKPDSFSGSREWIGTVEAALIIDQLFDVACKILHVNRGAELCNYTTELVEHFKNKKCPIMMGGDTDCSSKGIMGVHITENATYLLVVDPHFVGRPDPTKLAGSWVKWVSFADFMDGSFYNLCMPQIKI